MSNSHLKTHMLLRAGRPHCNAGNTQVRPAADEEAAPGASGLPTPARRPQPGRATNPFSLRFNHCRRNWKSAVARAGVLLRSGKECGLRCALDALKHFAEPRCGNSVGGAPSTVQLPLSSVNTAPTPRSVWATRYATAGFLRPVPSRLLPQSSELLI